MLGIGGEFRVEGGGVGEVADEVVRLVPDPRRGIGLVDLRHGIGAQVAPDGFARRALDADGDAPRCGIALGEAQGAGLQNGTARSGADKPVMLVGPVACETVRVRRADAADADAGERFARLRGGRLHLRRDAVAPVGGNPVERFAGYDPDCPFGVRLRDADCVALEGYAALGAAEAQNLERGLSVADRGDPRLGVVGDAGDFARRQRPAIGRGEGRRGGGKQNKGGNASFHSRPRLHAR